MVLFQNCVRQLRSPATVQLRCYWKQLWSRWAITGSWEPLVFTKLGDIDLIFVIWAYDDELQIKFTFRSSPMIFGWVMVLELKFGQIFSCHHFFSQCLEILTWFLAYECIMMNYRSSLHFVPVQWFLVELIMALRLWNLAKYLVVTTFFRYAWRYWPDFWYMTYECIMMSYRSSLHFVPVQWLLVELWSLNWNLAKYLVVTIFFRKAWRYWIDFCYMNV